MKAMAKNLVCEIMLSQKESGYSHFLDSGKGPWWARSAMVMGPLAFIALLGMLQAMGFLPSPVLQGQGEMKSQLASLHYVMQVICENTSKSEINALKCHPRPNTKSSLVQNPPPFTSDF